MVDRSKARSRLTHFPSIFLMSFTNRFMPCSECVDRFSEQARARAARRIGASATDSHGSSDVHTPVISLKSGRMSCREVGFDFEMLWWTVAMIPLEFVTRLVL